VFQLLFLFFFTLRLHLLTFLLANIPLTMGRRSKNGEAPLEKDQVLFLKTFAAEALGVRAALEHNNGLFRTLREWVAAVPIPRYNTTFAVPVTPYKEIVSLVHSHY
jgi:hypothetical protein